MEQKNGQSAYMQLYSQIRKDITDGVFSFGDKLPSKRTLAQETHTSVITVEHAFDILRDEGYVESRQRSGYFVIYRKEEMVPVSTQEKEYQNDPAEESRFPQEFIFPFSVMAKTMRNVLSKYGERVMVKSPNPGSRELRQAVCDYLARARGIRVKPMQIVIGSGAEYLYGLIVQILGREKIFGLENPSYDKIRAVYTANGAVCQLLKMGKEGILPSELKRTTAQVLHVTPFHSFPSGVTATASRRNAYIQWAEERNGMLIEDDFSSEFTVSSKNEDTVFSLEPENHVIYLNTFSKTIAPSVRIGYMVLPGERTEEFLKKISFYSCTVPAFEQYVLAELLNHGDFERHINRVRRKRRQEIKTGR